MLTNSCFGKTFTQSHQRPFRGISFAVVFVVAVGSGDGFHFDRQYGFDVWMHRLAHFELVVIQLAFALLFIVVAEVVELEQRGGFE